MDKKIDVVFLAEISVFRVKNSFSELFLTLRNTVWCLSYVQLTPKGLTDLNQIRHVVIC